MTLTPEAALIIVEQLVPNGKLIHIQEVVFLGAWAGWSYDRIAKESGYNQGHVKNTGGQLWALLSKFFGEKVTKANLPGAFRRYVERDRSIATSPVGVDSHIDWGEAIDASIFYGRTTELKSLTSWVQTQQCRLVAICGMAGIGKTALAVKLTEAVAADFDRVVWIGLRDTPPIAELLDDIIQRLSPADRPRTVVENVAAEIANLMKILSRGRYLIVLDNFDAVFSSTPTLEPIDPSRVDRPNYYLELLKSAGELRHQSCVLVTTREKPSAIAALAGEALPVRTLALAGLGQAAASELLRDKGLTADRSCGRLVKNYGGHPLALKVVAATIQDLFSGDIDLFIGAGVSGFRELDRFLVPQFERLTALEEQILYWLAIDRTSISLDELQSAIGQQETRWEIQTALLSLQRRSLVERNPQGFGLHPVVMEFVTARFLDRLCAEIASGECAPILNNYPLMKATAAEYVRERQIRMILAPLCERLFKQLADMKRVRSQILSLFDRLRDRDLHRQGYGIGNCLNLCRHLQIDLTGIDLSEASIRQAYLADVQLHNVNCRAADFQDCRIAQTFGGMTCVTFSPNGELLATCDANGEIQLWQVADSRRLLTLRGHDYWLWSVEFSPDGRQLVTGGQDRTARLWDIQTGACLYTISESSVINHVTFSPDGELLATSCEDGPVKLWNAKTGELVQTLSGHERRTWSAAFFPDGKTLVSGSEDGTVKLWDVATGTCQQTWRGHQNWVWKVAVSPDGQTIASTSFDLTTRLWDVETATCRLILTGHRDFIIAAAFSPDGKSIATGSYDKTIKIWDVATGACQQTWEKHTSRIWSVAFHPEGAMLASGADDYTVRLWNTQTGRCTQLLQGYSNQIFSVAIDRAGRSIASGHEDQTICLWRVDADGQPILDRKLTGHNNRVLSVAFDPSKPRLASSSCDRTIQLWDLGSGHCTHTLHGHQSWVWSVAFAPNGRVLASASYDHAVRIWDTTTGACLHTLTRAGTGAVQQVSFSPDGSWLASCGYPHTINIWDGETASYCHQLVGHKDRVWSMGWIGCDRLATGSEDGTICLWSVADAACLRTWSAHNCQVFCLEYDPTTDRLFSSDAKGQLKIWDLATGHLMATIDAHDHWLFSFCFTPDRRHLYTSSLDGKLKLWDLATQGCLVELIPPRPYEGMQIAGITGLNDAEYSTLITLGASALSPQQLS
jgi:WD40 repeat protein